MAGIEGMVMAGIEGMVMAGMEGKGGGHGRY